MKNLAEQIKAASALRDEQAARKKAATEAMLSVIEKREAAVRDATPRVRDLLMSETLLANTALEESTFAERFMFSEDLIREASHALAATIALQHPDKGMVARIALRVCATSGAITLQAYEGSLKSFRGKSRVFDAVTLTPEQVQAILGILFSFIAPEPEPPPDFHSRARHRRLRGFR